MKRQIFAMGGGGFLMEPENPLLDLYFLSLSPKPNPKVCFVSTASGDSQDAIDRYYKAMGNHKCTPSHLALFRGPVGSLRDYVLEKDVIYVGGGNTRNLLALWKEWGLDEILLEAYDRGIILGGISAGSLCWFEQGVTDSIPGALSGINCLGLLPGSNCPHYDGEPGRRPAYQKLVAEGMKGGLACDDGVAGHFINGKLHKLVSSRQNAKAFRIELISGKPLETELNPEFLGAFFKNSDNRNSNSELK